VKSHKKIILLIFAMLAVLVVTAIARFHSVGQGNVSSQARQSIDESHWPVTDYEPPVLADPVKRAKRQTRGKRHDKSEWAVNPADVADSTVRVDFVDLRLPAFPIEQSDTVVIGEIMDAQSYLSNDKTGIYSEFNLSVNEVLKNDAHLPLSPGCSLEMEREGGRVRFPSGRVHWYAIDKENMPRVGRRYVLFLTRESQEQVYRLLIGYELSASKVLPLDGYPNLQAYKNADETTFLNELRAKIATSSQASPE
jgi:hypothetical protein